MEVKRLHDWDLSIPEAKELQVRLAGQVSRQAEPLSPRLIAGLDISSRRWNDYATAAVVVISYPELEIVETRTVREKLNFPYVPGYLSFREAEISLKAIEQLDVTPDLFIADGQGIAHPRRLGLGAHLGLFLDRPTIGCAKSLLCGSFEAPGEQAGSRSYILDNDEIIGAAVRTRSGVKPVFVSIGHRIDLESAVDWVLKCSRYRLPEPTRQAHFAAGAGMRSAAAATAAG